LSDSVPARFAMIVPSLVLLSAGLLLLAIDTLGMNLDCVAQVYKARTELSPIGAVTAAIGLGAVMASQLF
jgi:hypothetical protein